MNKSLAAVTVMTIAKFDNDILAAAYNGLTGFGKIAEQNRAYETMKKSNLIHSDGTPFDTEPLIAALSFVINERVEAGTFR